MHHLLFGEAEPQQGLADFLHVLRYLEASPRKLVVFLVQIHFVHLPVSPPVDDGTAIKKRPNGLPLEAARDACGLRYSERRVPEGRKA